MISSSVEANERLGQLSVEDLLLRPMFKMTEGPDGEFSVYQSSINFLWIMDESFKAQLRLGSLQLRNPMLHYADEVSNELGLVEAFAEYSGMLGQISMGLLPVEYGIEGSWLERDLIFERSLFFEKRILPLRDFGFKYKVDFKGFYTHIMVLNGEGDSENRDGRMFVSSKWGWTNYRNVDVGVSGFSGTIKPDESAALPTSYLASANYSLESLWRIGTFYLYWHPNQWHFLLETHFGELEQNEIMTKFNGGHVDWGYNWSDQLATFIRYDHLDPDDSRDGDMIRKSSLAFALYDKYKTNTWILSAAKVYEQQSQINNDELFLVWRVTPVSR
jgi:hypothetical protein